MSALQAWLEIAMVRERVEIKRDPVKIKENLADE
jgi:hypothetical protein